VRATPRDFYEEARFCGRCKQFVPYLVSPDGTYCVLCDWELSLSAQRIDRGPHRNSIALAPGPAPCGPPRPESTLPPG
jgi:hypothetical protein